MTETRKMQCQNQERAVVLFDKSVTWGTRATVRSRQMTTISKLSYFMGLTIVLIGLVITIYLMNRAISSANTEAIRAIFGLGAVITAWVVMVLNKGVYVVIDDNTAKVHYGSVFGSNPTQSLGSSRVTIYGGRLRFEWIRKMRFLHPVARVFPSDYSRWTSDNDRD